MRYYIDFEASEQQQTIISVGCVSDSGREFYSLVHTEDSITLRIEQITGITQKDVDDAPSSSQVFEQLYDWISNDEEVPDFYCYGDGDLDFVYNNYMLATSFKEAAMLSYLYVNLYDCSEEIKDHFFVNKTISLEKLGQHFDQNMGAQNHNALDDAKLLKMVYDHTRSEQKENNVFNEYVDNRRIPSEIRSVLRLQGNTIVAEYQSMEEAVEWCRKQPNDKGPTYLKNIDEKIRNAARTGSKYMNCNWRIL